MPRKKKADVPGQMCMSLEQAEEKTEGVNAFNNEEYDKVQIHVLNTGKGSIGNLMRVFRISANRADEYLSQLKENKIIGLDGRVQKKNKERSLYTKNMAY